MAVRIVFPSASLAGFSIVDAELSFSDGSVVTGTADIFTGLDGLSVPNSSHPVNFMKIGNKLVFQVTDNAHGRELWVTDGTVAGTEFLVDINTVAPTDTHDSTERTSSWQFSQESVFKFQAPAVFDGFTYFKADDGVNGIELWRTDGTALGTTLVANINPGVNGSSPFLLTASGDFLYFAATTQANGTELWKTDGTTTEIVANLVAGNGNSNPDNLTDFNGTLFFTAASESGGPSHLWQTTGGAPTQISGADFASQLTPLGNLLLFNKADNANGAELWVYDGTTAHIVKNIATTPVPPGPNTDFGSNPQNLAAFNGFVYFWAQDDTHGFEVWRSDGTEDSTTLFADINTTGPNVSSGPGSPFVVSGNKLYFLANNGFTGQELWVTDGVDATNNPLPVANVGVTAVNDAPVLNVNTGTAVNEGAGTTILNAQLDFNDPEQSDAQITYTVTSLTANGTLFRNAVALGAGGTFTQADIVGNLLSYTHDGGETTSDSFGFSVSDGIAPAITGQTFAITVTPQNDPPALNANTGTTVNEGAGTTILNAQLDFNDPDSSDAQITYTLTSLTANGSLFRNGVALGAGGTFTQADIVGNLLTYTHNGSETTSDSFGFSVSDGFAPAITGQSFAITVTPQNDPPVLNANTGTTVNEGAGTTILNAQLDFNDPEQSDAQITYTVTSLTANGTLFRNAVALGVGGTFTQADIAGNLLTYTHNGGETTSDSFGFSVSDGIAPAIIGQTFAIAVTPQNDPLSITSNGGGATASINLPENATAVTTVTVTDPDGPSLAFSIVGGDDAAKFQIDASSGALSFITAPNFESPADLDHNNTYLVQVRASDGSLSDDQVITVQVGDATEVLHWIQSVDAGVHPDPNPTAHTIGRGLGGFLAPGWLPSGIGDFNNDATSDLAWYHPGTNGIDIWKLSNGQWAGSADTGTHPAGYQPAGVGDFNGDGTDDILWFNATTRDLELWKISNGQWAGSVDIGTHPPGYVPSGVGDFNGDGTSDVLWYNASTHDAEIWAISNGQWAGSTDVGLHPAGYQPTLIGDFDGDGTSDIGWYNASNGALDLWKISNGQWAGSVDLGAHPAGWHPLGAADFNTDGTSDIAWYNPTANNIDIWLIKNGQWSESVNIGSHPAGPTAVGIGDFDHNGVNDITWFNPITGQIENWLLAYS